MNTITQDGKTWHVGCGGEVIKGICIRCGEKKRKRSLLGSGPLIIEEPKFDPKEYRKRIRESRDIQ